MVASSTLVYVSAPTATCAIIIRDDGAPQLRSQDVFGASRASLVFSFCRSIKCESHRWAFHRQTLTRARKYRGPCLLILGLAMSLCKVYAFHGCGPRWGCGTPGSTWRLFNRLWHLHGHAVHRRGSFALLELHFPNVTVEEIRTMLQTTATPLPWIYNQSMLSATPPQGAGPVNVCKVIASNTQVSPGQLLISNVSKTVYGTQAVSECPQALQGWRAHGSLSSRGQS